MNRVNVCMDGLCVYVCVYMCIYIYTLYICVYVHIHEPIMGDEERREDLLINAPC